MNDNKLSQAFALLEAALTECNADPKNPAYEVADFRRKPQFEEAISMSAPQWHR